MKVLDVQNLNVQYHTEKGSFDAVSGLSLSMEEGEITGLVGQSGCGKSTAVRAIMGISAEIPIIARTAVLFPQPDRPTSPVISPSSIERESPLTALKSPFSV